MDDPRLNQAVFTDPGGTTYAQRCEALIDYFAEREPAGHVPRLGFIEIAARLFRNRPMDTILPVLEPLLAQPFGDMFWMYPMVSLQYLGRERLPDAVRERMRQVWRSYTPYRGDTENHWLLYYASLYLVCQQFPDDPAPTWFNGRSAQENMEEADAYVQHWVALTTTMGQGEYDSPHYLAFYLVPLALLYAFAEDRAMQRRAHMMLDYLIADFAAESLGGLYAGAFSRIYPEPVLTRGRNGSTSFAWLLFGNVPFRPDAVNVVVPRAGYRPHGVAALLAMSGCEPPPVLHGIATDRSVPYVHRERKRTRHRIRYSAVRNAPVYKITFVRSEYVLGSTQGGLLQPVQQHTWELLWATDAPHDVCNVLFCMHPYAGPYEMGMYFPEEPKLLVETVAQHEKGTYDQPDKLTGGSPYEQVVQHEEALIALYDIAPDARFPHINAFFSADLRDRDENASGWIFARGGAAFIGYYPLAPYRWEPLPDARRAAVTHARLVSPHRKNGAVVQVAPASAYTSFDAFKEAVRSLVLETTTEPTPSVRFTTLGGDDLAMTYGETPTVNGTPVDYDAWPLFDGPFMQAEPGSKRLELRHGPTRRVLDFDALTITDFTDA